MKTWLRWTLLSGAIGTLIVVPFLLYGEAIEAQVTRFMADAGRHSVETALVLGGLLAGDVILPTPSSIVSTACGATLGFWIGTGVSWVGMSLSCLAGYWIGLTGGRGFVLRLMGTGNMERLHRLGKRHGPWVVVVTRPVPVLAEAATLFAGLGGMPPGRFVLMTAAANLGISAAYAAIGAFAVSVSGFAAAFTGALVLPALFMAAARRADRL